MSYDTEASNAALDEGAAPHAVSGGRWYRRPGGLVVVLDEGANLLTESEYDGEDEFRPPKARALTASDVLDKRIDGPAQRALVRLSKRAATSADAVTMLEHVKARRLAGIHCANSQVAIARAVKLGTSYWLAIPAGEDAVLMLDPADVQKSAPLIAYRRELDPECGLLRGEKKLPPAQARLDAALLKALASYKVWQTGLQLGGSAKCAIAPLQSGAAAARPAAGSATRMLNNVLPRLLCRPRAVTATPGTPRLVRHRHVRRTCDSAFAWNSDAAPIDLLPASMNPRFILPNDQLSFDHTLDLRLNELLVTKYKSFLAPQSVKARAASAQDKLRVALVDLTGRRKLCQPGYAGWGSTFSVSGASTAKIALYYAAHQMLFDLRELAKAQGIRRAADLIDKTKDEWSSFICKPDLRWLFRFDEAANPLGIEKSAALQQHLLDVVQERASTSRAVELIMRLSFEYIGSLMWQSGLRHPQRAGLWFGSTFCTGSRTAKLDAKCHVISTAGCASGQHRVVWSKDPLNIRRIVLTAQSVASFFTLLAQGRLVNPALSTEIEGLLRLACSFIREAMPGANVRATKCGLTSALLHDGALVENGTRRYVIVFLTENAGMPKATRIRLINDLDTLIKNNNP